MGTSNRTLPSSKANPGSDTNGMDQGEATSRAEARAYVSAGAVAASSGGAAKLIGDRLKRAVQTQK